MDARSPSSCFGSYRETIIWAGVCGLVQGGILLLLSVMALLRQLWSVGVDKTKDLRALLYIFYFYNPYGENGQKLNPLAFRTQILGYLYAVLSCLWFILSIVLLSRAGRNRGSPWAHYCWVTITSLILVTDVAAALLCVRDVAIITNFDSLKMETGYPIDTLQAVSSFFFAIAPLLMIAVFSKGIVFWVLDVVFVYYVVVIGRSFTKKQAHSRHSYSRYQENARTVAQSLSTPPTPVSAPAAAAIAAVTGQQTSPNEMNREFSPEEVRLGRLNEELAARLRGDGQGRERNPHWERVGRSPSPRVISLPPELGSKYSSHQTTPELNRRYSSKPSSYHQSPVSPYQAAQARRLGRTWSPVETESVSTIIETPKTPVRNPQSTNLGHQVPDTWWIPSDDEPQRRPTQAPRAPVSELRAQLPWSYIQAPLELDPASLQSTPGLPRVSTNMQKTPVIPAPDYTAHQSRHRNSFREHRGTPSQPHRLERSVSDFGRGIPGRNVYNAPFVITDAHSRSPHFLRRPPQYLPEVNDRRE